MAAIAVLALLMVGHATAAAASDAGDGSGAGGIGSTLGSSLRLLARGLRRMNEQAHHGTVKDYYLHHHRSPGLHATATEGRDAMREHLRDFDVLVRRYGDDPTVSRHLEEFTTHRRTVAELAKEYATLQAASMELVGRERSDVKQMHEHLAGMDEAFKRGDRTGVAHHLAEAIGHLSDTHAFVERLSERHAGVEERLGLEAAALSEQVQALSHDAGAAKASERRGTALSMGAVVATELLADVLGGAGMVVNVGERLLGYGTSALLFKQGQEAAGRAVALSTLEQAVVGDFQRNVAEVTLRLREVSNKYADILAMLQHTQHVLRDAQDDADVSGHHHGSTEEARAEAAKAFEVAHVAASYLDNAYAHYMREIEDLQAEAEARAAEAEGEGEGRLTGEL